jgi:hypothetical protein
MVNIGFLEYEQYMDISVPTRCAAIGAEKKRRLQDESRWKGTHNSDSNASASRSSDFCDGMSDTSSRDTA